MTIHFLHQSVNHIAGSMCFRMIIDNSNRAGVGFDYRYAIPNGLIFPERAISGPSDMPDVNGIWLMTPFYVIITWHGLIKT
jgi:hypothetical protein